MGYDSQDSKLDISGSNKTNRLRKALLFADAVIVFVNMANYYTILNALIMTPKRSINTVIVFLLNCIYLAIRRGTRVKLMKGDILFLCYLLVVAVNLVSSMVSHTLIPGFLPFFGANITFYLLLVNIYGDYRKREGYRKSLQRVFRGYIWFFALNALSVCLMQALVNFAGLSPNVNEITTRFDLFDSNMQKFGSHYYFPYNLSVVLADNELRIPLFQDKGYFLGFFHEPHTYMFFITPIALYCVFVAKSKVIRYLLSFVLVLLVLSCGSVTNILSILAALLAFGVARNRRNIILVAVAIILGLTAFLAIDPEIYAFIVDRFSSGSADYSKTTLSFALTPRTLLGTNFLDLSYWDKGMRNYDVGFLPCILNIVFLLLFVFYIFKMFWVRNRFFNVIGMISLYFLIHSTKQAMVTYTIPLLVFIMFLLNASSQEINQRKLIVWSPRI